MVAPLPSDAWDLLRRRACAALLTRVRARIEPPSSHATLALARDAEHSQVDPRSPDAVAWCANGSIYCEALGSLESHIDAYVAVQEQIDPNDPPALTVSQVNDGSFGHRRILGFIDLAVARLRRCP